MKTKFNSALTGLCILAGSAAHAGTTTAPEPATHPVSTTEPWLTASLSVGYETLHVYRGADSSFGQAIVWESLDLNLFNFLRFNLFNGNSFDGKYGELTPSLSIYRDFGPLTAAAGMIWYHFPGEDGVDSEEYYLSLSGDLGAGFSARAWASYNARAEGWYHEMMLKHSFEISQRVKFETSAALGYSRDLRSGGDGWDNLTIALGLPVSISQSLTLTPLLGYAFALDALDSGDEAWAGITASYQF
jgi:hypothetical protein